MKFFKKSKVWIYMALTSLAAAFVCMMSPAASVLAAGEEAQEKMDPQIGWILVGIIALVVIVAVIVAAVTSVISGVVGAQEDSGDQQ